MASSNGKSLGRGLDALFQKREQPAQASPEGICPWRMAPLKALAPNPDQPRKVFDEESLKELAASISARGILQPLVVRETSPGRYQIIAGERRWRAARLAGLEEAPVIVLDLDDREAMLAGLIENIQRESLNPIDHARAIRTLLEALELTHAQLAEKLGVARSVVSNSLRLLDLGPDAQASLLAGEISASHARCLAGLPKEAASELRARIIEKRLNVRETEAAAALWQAEGRFPWTQARPPAAKADREAMRKLSRALENALQWPVKVHGGPESGQISFPYRDIYELNDLLEKFGAPESVWKKE